MATQYSTTVRNAANDQIQTTIGTAPLLKFYTGSVPATCATAVSGTLLISITLPSTWLGASSSGVKSLSGTWSGTASGTGTAGYYRIYDSTGTTCHEQGTITATGGGGDITLDNTSIASGQTVTVSTYTKTFSGA